MPKKIVSAGLICLDIVPVFTSSAVKSPGEIFVPGKLIEVGNVGIHIGGSVANTGLAFQFFGCDVTLMGKVGNDYFGNLLMQILREHNSAESMIISPDCNTSYSMVLSPAGIDRIFLHYPGADNSFCYDDLDFERIGTADLFHFGYPTIMKKLYENSGEQLVRIFRQVKEHGVMTSLDMAAIDPQSDAGKTDWTIILQKLMPYVDFFVPSVEELCFMLDRKRHEEWMKRADGRDVTRILDVGRDIKPLSDQLLRWGAKVVLIKCGAPGMYLRTGSVDAIESLGAGYERWANLDTFEYSYKEERFYSSTGAGDVSIAAFLTAAIEGYTPARCLELATGAGTCCVAAYDALSGLISFEEMIKKIDSGWEKNKF